MCARGPREVLPSPRTYCPPAFPRSAHQHRAQLLPASPPCSLHPCSEPSTTGRCPMSPPSLLSSPGLHRHIKVSGRELTFSSTCNARLQEQAAAWCGGGWACTLTRAGGRCGPPCSWRRPPLGGARLLGTSPVGEEVGTEKSGTGQEPGAIVKSSGCSALVVRHHGPPRQGS